jgi:1-acyl-sn-glycerol-3-phosphate acyltransferase
MKLLTFLKNSFRIKLVPMDQRWRSLVRKIAERVLPKEEKERFLLLQSQLKDEGFGYDIFGFEAESALAYYLFFNLLYKYWFRVKSEGHKNIPPRGRGMLVINHSGMLPLDFIMIAIDVMKHANPPRIVRGIVDHFAGGLPYINLFIYRGGSVIGSRENMEELLKADQLIGVFPEGTKGIGKPFSQRYKLVRFNVGFVELAIKYKAPIVPVAVIGAEEQYIQIGKIKWLGRLFGFPYIPVTPTFPWLGVLGLIPLPSRYYIYYGEPIKLYKKYSSAEAEDPELIRRLADQIQNIVQEMINKGLKKRKSIFF